MRRSRRNRLVWFQLQANSYQYEIALCAVSHIGTNVCQISYHGVRGISATHEFNPRHLVSFCIGKDHTQSETSQNPSRKNRRPQRDYFRFADHTLNDTDQAGTLWIEWGMEESE